MQVNRCSHVLNRLGSHMIKYGKVINEKCIKHTSGSRNMKQKKSIFRHILNIITTLGHAVNVHIARSNERKRERRIEERRLQKIYATSKAEAAGRTAGELQERENNKIKQQNARERRKKNKELDDFFSGRSDSFVSPDSGGKKKGKNKKKDEEFPSLVK